MQDEQEQPETSASAAAGAGGMSRAGSKATRSIPAAELSQATNILAAKTRRSRLANVTSATGQGHPLLSNTVKSGSCIAPKACCVVAALFSQSDYAPDCNLPHTEHLYLGPNCSHVSVLSIITV